MFLTKSRRDGTVIVAVCVSLVGLMTFMALSLDGGTVLDKRRHTQAGADAAALAAAAELYARTFANPNGLDPDGSIAALALQIAEDNGFKNGAGGVTVEVYIPPISGPFTGVGGHAEVVITAPQRRFLGGVFGANADMVVKARAVGRGRRFVPNVGIMALHPTLKGSFQTGGGGSASVTGSAKVIVNSNNAEGMIANGGGIMAAGEFDLGGAPGYATPGGAQILGLIKSEQDPQPDPLRFVPQPVASDYQTQSTKKLQYSNADVITLKPGVYVGGITATSKANLVLLPGVYYMKGGGFNFAGGSLTGTGVMIYNDPASTSDTISISGGSGGVIMSPPSSGTYQGISLFQRRDSTNTISVTGNGSGPLSITGTFYAAGGTLKATGNGTSDTIGSQYISNIITTGGNGSFNVSWDPNVIPAIRELYLVE